MLARMQPTIAHISIHALREEGDVLTSIKDNHPRIFLSTPSARRATFSPFDCAKRCDISIHALREEGDARRRKHSKRSARFLSTPSARRATAGR